MFVLKTCQGSSGIDGADGGGRKSLRSELKLTGCKQKLKQDVPDTEETTEAAALLLHRRHVATENKEAIEQRGKRLKYGKSEKLKTSSDENGVFDMFSDNGGHL